MTTIKKAAIEYAKSHKYEWREDCFQAGATWALDEAIKEMKQLKNISRRLDAIKDNQDRVFGYADALSEVQEIIEKLRVG